MRPLEKIINLTALKKNYQHLQQLAAGAEVIAVVKADAYGHGVKNILPALGEARQFAVASIDEALALRQLGVTAERPILLLEGIFSPEEAPICAAANFRPCIHNRAQLDWLKETRGVKAWLKIDVGMHRLGFDAREQDWLAAAKSAENLDWQGILAHFPCADESDPATTQAQIERLQSLSLPAGWRRCFANSAAIFHFPNAHQNAVRAGLALYGMSPFANKTAAELGLLPVMTLQTAVLALRRLEKGEGAGYGWHFRAPQAGNLATIALGYGDGFPRAIDSGAVFLHLNGKHYPLVGRVAMDMALLWLGDDMAEIGDIITVFGQNHPVEKVAAQANTIPYTLTTMLTARPRTKVIH